MKFFNKQVLAAAIVGALASGNALADAEIDVTAAVFAEEIALPETLTVPVTWNLGYNFNDSELRYACLRLEGATPVPGSVTPVVDDGAGGTVPMTVGAVNVSGNVAFFTLTSGTLAGAPTEDFEVTVPALQVEVADRNVQVIGTVGLYDNPAAAGACAAPGPSNPQLIPGTSDTEKLLSFAPSFTFKADPNQATASVEAVPSYSEFIASIMPITVATTTDARLANIELAPVTTVAADMPLKADGNPITLADIFPLVGDLAIEGDFGDWTTAVEFDDATVTAGAIAPDQESAAWAVNPSTGFDGEFEVTNGGTDPDTGEKLEIPAGIYTASLTVTPNAGYDLGAGDNEEVTLVPSIDEALETGTDNSVSDSAAIAGQIIQDGVRLQAPLVQMPGTSWISRMVITNTGKKDRKITLKVYSEDGNVISTGALEHEVKAESTYVINDMAEVMTGFSGKSRGTVVAIVAAPEHEVKGLYQIVNRDSGAISNYVMVNQETGGH